jgi:hypothetical protein
MLKGVRSMEYNNTNCNEKITLWTSQSKIVLDTLNEKGVYHVKKDFILNKYEDVSHIFLEAYNYFISKAKDIVPIPEGSEYPIWLFTDLRYVDKHEDNYILKIKVDRNKVILFDMEKWNRILNLSYIPENQEDARKHAELLEKYGINNETDVYLKSYYPHLKLKVRSSWDRLFDENIVLSPYKQAALWEIRKEWVVIVE